MGLFEPKFGELGRLWLLASREWFPIMLKFLLKTLQKGGDVEQGLEDHNHCTMHIEPSPIRVATNNNTRFVFHDLNWRGGRAKEWVVNNGPITCA
jgi:hypothetical protein